MITKKMAGAPIIYEAPNGTQYKLQPITWRMKDQLSEIVFLHKKNLLSKVRSELSEESYERKLDQLMQEYESGDYSPDQPIGKSFFAGVNGQLQMGSLIFGCSPDEMVELILADKIGVIKHLEMITKASLRSVESTDESDPN